MPVLDWRRHAVAARPGKCRHCGRGALLRDETGRPCHKVCAEAAADRTAASAADNYASRTTDQKGQ